MPQSDSELIAECLKGSEAAWSALLDQYKNLIFSIPIKYDLPRDQAADIFHAVVVDLLSELPRLRDPRALPAWLIQVTSHKCLRWKTREQRFDPLDIPESAPQQAEDLSAKTPEHIVRELQLEQALRESQAQLSPRCRQLVQMLFYEAPPRPYAEIAQQLGIAKGSVGFIRQRCLARLQTLLAKAGVA